MRDASLLTCNTASTPAIEAEKNQIRSVQKTVGREKKSLAMGGLGNGHRAHGVRLHRRPKAPHTSCRDATLKKHRSADI